MSSARRPSERALRKAGPHQAVLKAEQDAALGAVRSAGVQHYAALLLAAGFTRELHDLQVDARFQARDLLATACELICSGCGLRRQVASRRFLGLDGHVVPMYLLNMSEPTTTPTMKISIDPDFEADLVQCMVKMKPTDEHGRVRSITIQDAIREAVHQMAKRSK